MMSIEEYKFQLDALRKLIRSQKRFDEAIESTLKLHAITHTGTVSSSSVPTLCDEILEGLSNEDYSVMPAKNDETIAWHLWHIARIEDLVGNLLIAEGPQLFNDEWMTRLHVTIKDTGNAMTNKEMLDFSEKVNKQELIHYRNEVGCQTRKTIRSLTLNDLKRKPKEENLARLLSEGGLLETKKSLWLKDFGEDIQYPGLCCCR